MEDDQREVCEEDADQVALLAEIGEGRLARARSRVRREPVEDYRDRAQARAVGGGGVPVTADSIPRRVSRPRIASGANSGDAASVFSPEPLARLYGGASRGVLCLPTLLLVGADELGVRQHVSLDRL